MPEGTKSPAPPSFYNRMAEMSPAGAGSAAPPEKSPEAGGDIGEIVAKMLMVVDKLAKMGKEVEPYATRIKDVLQELDMNVVKKGAGTGAPGNAPPPAPASPGPAPAAAGGAEAQPVPA
jgi:hypothetical protein